MSLELVWLTDHSGWDFFCKLCHLFVDEFLDCQNIIFDVCMSSIVIVLVLSDQLPSFCGPNYLSPKQFLKNNQNWCQFGSQIET